MDNILNNNLSYCSLLFVRFTFFTDIQEMLHGDFFSISQKVNSSGFFREI